ncbi:MAG: conjugal transfer protein TraL [Bryobacteraceae bacterium]
MSQNGAPVQYAAKDAMFVAEGKEKAEVFANSIHLSLQGKGGVGKSLVASILAQYFNARGKAVRCVDTDPVNRTLFQYKALNVNRLELLREGSIDQRGFDSLMETLLTEDATFIVDNGASTFIPLWSYILENSAIDVLTRAGKRLYVHTVITGGQALLDTLQGFKSLAESTSERNIIVWLNEYFGRIERDGKSFEDMGAYRESENKVFGSVHLTKRNQDTFGRDLEEVISRKLTLDEAIKDGPFSIMTKQRLKVMQRDWFEQIDCLALI